MKKLARHKNRSENCRNAKRLRQEGSLIERILWRALRTNPEQKEIKFRYQHPIRPYIVDFACLAARVIVEVDGLSHDVSPNIDQQRQKFLEDEGYYVMRFSNAEVWKNVAAVAEIIRSTARERLKPDGVGLTPPRNR
jgi:very-short-patch-repair endonuclease